MRKLLLSGVAVAAITVAVGEPAKAAPPVFNWTGCYAGANIGGGWANKDFVTGTFGSSGAGPASMHSFVGGAQLGCDVQYGMLVFGVQGMFDWSSMHGNSPFFIGKSFSTHIPWFATATGRVGYAVQPALLLFVRGGAAFVRDQHDFIDLPVSPAEKASVTRKGWTLGGGFDWMFAPNWSVAVEYGYMGFGTKFVNFEPQAGFAGALSEQISQHAQFVLLSVNYRFGSGGPR
jgi:outer membrane immunogenic protein